MGKTIGETIRCGYHGLRFDSARRLRGNSRSGYDPAQREGPLYPVVEKFGWVWIWMGDPAKADLSLIPNWWWCEHKDWAMTKPDLLYINCNYELVTDNLLDVTHLAYVHATSIGTAAITEFPIETSRDGNKVRMTRWVDRPPGAADVPKRSASFPATPTADRSSNSSRRPSTVNFAQVADTGTRRAAKARAARAAST